MTIPVAFPRLRPHSASAPFSHAHEETPRRAKYMKRVYTTAAPRVLERHGYLAAGACQSRPGTPFTHRPPLLRTTTACDYKLVSVHSWLSQRYSQIGKMPEIFDDKSEHFIPFILERLALHNRKHAGEQNPPPFFLGLNGVQGAGKTTLVGGSFCWCLLNRPTHIAVLWLSYVMKCSKCTFRSAISREFSYSAKVYP